MVIAGVNLVTRTDTDDFWREYVRLLLERVVRQKYNGSEQTEQEWIPFLRDTVRLSSGRVRQQRQRARCLSPEGEFRLSAGSVYVGCGGDVLGSDTS